MYLTIWSPIIISLNILCIFMTYNPHIIPQMFCLSQYFTLVWKTDGVYSMYCTDYFTTVVPISNAPLWWTAFSWQKNINYGHIHFSDAPSRLVYPVWNKHHPEFPPFSLCHIAFAKNSRESITVSFPVLFSSVPSMSPLPHCTNGWIWRWEERKKHDDDFDLSWLAR